MNRICSTQGGAVTSASHGQNNRVTITPLAMQSVDNVASCAAALSDGEPDEDPNYECAFCNKEIRDAISEWYDDCGGCFRPGLHFEQHKTEWPCPEDFLYAIGVTISSLTLNMITMVNVKCSSITNATESTGRGRDSCLWRRKITN